MPPPTAVQQQILWAVQLAFAIIGTVALSASALLSWQATRRIERHRREVGARLLASLPPPQCPACGVKFTPGSSEDAHMN